MRNIIIKRYPLVDILTGKRTEILYNLYYEDGTHIMNTDFKGMMEFLTTIHEDKIESV